MASLIYSSQGFVAAKSHLLLNTFEGADDQAMLLAYDIENEDACIKIMGQFRQLGEDVLPVHYPKISSPKEKKRATFHCYFASVAADRSSQSDSIYLGEITF